LYSAIPALRNISHTCARLRRAGFLQDPDSEYVLIDSENGWKIRLLEEIPETHQHYQEDSNSAKEDQQD
jgi:hypothetical protein